jgi:hypothetical protein
VIDVFDPVHPPADIMETMLKIMVASILLGVIAWVSAYIFFAFF